MRYSPDHKTESRKRILNAAAQQIRLKGPEKIGVADVMSAAGLTHGAFYAHFNSKDALVAEAIAAMFTEVQRHGGSLAEALDDEDADIRQALRAYLGDYLSPRHRDRPDGGCPLPTLAADLARTNGLARENFVSGIDRMTMRIQTALVRLGRSRAEADARAVVAQMVGAVGLARAVGVGAQSDAFLRDCLDALLTKLDL